MNKWKNKRNDILLHKYHCVQIFWEFSNNLSAFWVQLNICITSFIFQLILLYFIAFIKSSKSTFQFYLTTIASAECSCSQNQEWNIKSTTAKSLMELRTRSLMKIMLKDVLTFSLMYFWKMNLYKNPTDVLLKGKHFGYFSINMIYFLLPIQIFHQDIPSLSVILRQLLQMESVLWQWILMMTSLEFD